MYRINYVWWEKIKLSSYKKSIRQGRMTFTAKVGYRINLERYMIEEGEFTERKSKREVHHKKFRCKQ